VEVSQTGIPGLVVIRPRVFGDNRGFFLETHSRRAYAEAGLDYDFVQDNHARSGPKGVLRGLHFQRPPATQAKLVWVVRGAVFDVVVDLRVGSPTYGKWYGIELTEENFLRLMVPRGFAHGYVTLTENAEFMYKVDAPYAPDEDAGIAWNDPDIGVRWPIADPVLSAKDAVQPTLAAIGSPFVYVP
jgi:dTDP-4-dehydrorhamnose 3,5-epimerase